MSNMIKSDIDNIISKVLQGRGSETERTGLKDWLEASEEHRETYRQLRIEWSSKIAPRKAVNEEELIDNIWSRHSKILTKSDRSRSKMLTFSIMKSAAVFLALIVFTFIYYLTKSDQQLRNDTYEVAQKENKAGQKSKIYLTDGSLIWLNSNSTLTYTRPFRDNVREVELRGEAFFEIASDTLRPFVVKFSDTFVEVLGTSFNISAYDEDPQKVISLAEGKISLKHMDQHQVLTPGWIAEISHKTNTIESYKGDVSANLAWTRDELQFTNASYSEIFPKLERWYGMEILLEGSYDPEIKFTGTFKDEYLNNVLENLIMDRNMHYKIDQEKVIVTFK
jgi:transmembrane sensor